MSPVYLPGHVTGEGEGGAREEREDGEEEHVGGMTGLRSCLYGGIGVDWVVYYCMSVERSRERV